MMSRVARCAVCGCVARLVVSAVALLGASTAIAVPLEFTASGQTATSRAGGLAVPWTLRMIFDPAAMLPDSIAAPNVGAFGGASLLEVSIDGVVLLTTQDFGVADRGVITINDLAGTTGVTSDVVLLGGTTLTGERYIVTLGQNAFGGVPALLTSDALPQSLPAYQAILGSPVRSFQWGPTTANPVVGLVESVAIREVPVAVPEPDPGVLLLGALLALAVALGRTRRSKASA